MMQFNASLVVPVIGDTLAHIRANIRIFSMIFLASTAAGVGFDLSAALGETAILVALAFTFFNLFLQACIIIAILQSGGHMVRTRRWRMASLFGLGLLTGLGIAFGLIALILPGLYLAGRWFIAGAALFGEDMSVSDAMNASWEATEEHWLACSILALGVFALQAAPLLVGMYLVPEGDPAQIGTLIATNALSQGAWVFGCAAAATMYLTIGRRSIRTGEIFG